MSKKPHLHSVQSKVKEKLKLVEEMESLGGVPRGYRQSDQQRERRFWSLVKIKPNGCWEWQGGFRDKNYGGFSAKGREERSHRMSWILTFGEIPAGMDVLHNCDNPPCVRPDHLFLGTQADNNRDMVAKGRQAGPNGVRSPWAKLNDEKVKHIKQLLDNGHLRPFEIAKRFSISNGVIYLIRDGKAWKHVKL